MIDAHVTGIAALVLALTALLHAARAALPAVVEALKERSKAVRLDAEARAAAEGDLRERLDDCEARDVATRERADAAEERHAIEIGTLRGQLAAMRDELEDLRRSITAGHSHAR